MLQFLRRGKLKGLASFLSFILVFTMLPADRYIYAEETTGEESTVTWNFRGGEEGAYSGSVEGTAGEFEGIVIDAKTGSCTANDSGYTQLSIGTKLSVPVSGSAIIMVKADKDYHSYTIDGVSADSLDYQYTYTGEEGYVEIEVLDTVYLYEISESAYTEEEIPETSTDTGEEDKIDVWDFGAEQLDEEKYNNKLTADIINGLYPDTTPGTTGVNIAGFSLNDGEFLFNDGGKTTVHRLRSTNTALTRYDNKSLKSPDGNTTYTGYLYSNISSTSSVYLGVWLEKNDILTLCVAANSGNSTINTEAPDGTVTSQVYTYASGTAQEMTFYASEEGLYKVYSSNEKLVVARVYREHTGEVAVSGTVKAPAELSGYGITFTSQQTGESITAQVTDDYYEATLQEGYAYEVALSNASGYVITSSNTLSVPSDGESLTFDIDIGEVSMVTLTGEIKGLTTQALKKLTLQFTADTVYIPEITINDSGEYTLQLEKNITYSVTAEGVNDYSLTGDGTICAAEDGVVDFVFEEKTRYPVTVSLSGIQEEAADSAAVTFTNIKEEDYSYSYSLQEEIALRNGQYRVKVTGTGAYAAVMALTPDVIVSGGAVQAAVNFSELKDWDFSVYNSAYTGPGIETIDGSRYYLGLKLSDTGVQENKTYLLLDSGGTIGVPVKAGDLVTVNYCYSAAFCFEGDTASGVEESFGSTSSTGTASYTADTDGYLMIEGLSGEGKQTYLTSIEVSELQEYKDTLTVGAANCDYRTINAALEAVRNMERSDGERVTIEIQPGNYEEMLVVDVPDVTLKNASSSPSLALTDEGVHIASEAVRITSYYGHGYSYYSMGTDGKYDEDVLTVNGANGYLSYENPGAGTTSYWNATVVISGDGFKAEGIIFENSFNQYISEKEAEDMVVEGTGSKGERSKTQGDTSVQSKIFVERAAALAITSNTKEVYFDNCRFVGRQDTLYGGTGVLAAFYRCQVMGACDYIFGGMTGVFYKCSLIFNTSDESNDVGYIAAPQQTQGRGYLLYNCTVESTVPGEDTASEKDSKPGYFGRPWQADTSEAVFYKTIINATDYSGELDSMIEPAGWLSTLGGESSGMYEYGTMECLFGTDNSKNRVSWSTVLSEGILTDGTDISTAENALSAYLGSWSPFEVDDEDDTAVIVTPEPTDTTPVTLTLNASNLTLGTYTSAFESDGFTVNASADYSVAVDASSKTAEDGTSFTQRLKLSGTGTAEYRSIHFSTQSAASVTVYAMSSSSGEDRSLVLYDTEGQEAGSVTAYGTKLVPAAIEIAQAGDYYLASPSKGVNVYCVIVNYEGTGEDTDRADWSTVQAPVIDSVVQSEEKIVVTFALVTGTDGADKATVNRMDTSGTVIDSVLVGTNTTTNIRTAEFIPEDSGIYTFQVIAARNGEDTVKESAVTDYFTFVLPLEAPSITGVTNSGGGSVTVSWEEVKEADSYLVAYQKEGDTDSTVAAVVTQTSAVISGLTVGSQYTILVKARRGSEESEEAKSEITVTKNEERAWYFSAFGQGVNSSDNYYTGSVSEGSVTIASENGKGKLVPASTDGLAFYYTKVDPDKENFILSATVTVDSWTYSNGQEGFGLMAADAAGANGDSSVFWNNSFMNSVTKVEYYWDSANQQVSDTGDKIVMKLGIGAQRKIGVTAENIADGTISTNINELFTSSMYPLDTSCGTMGAGTYNIVGSYTNTEAPTGTLASGNLKTSFYLTLQRDNTGYRLSYTDEEGNTNTKLFYDLDRNALTQIDKDNIYVGFFAARNAKITVTDIDFTTSDPAADPPGEEQETTYVTPSYQVLSPAATGNAEYEMIFTANADGLLTIKDGKDNIITEKEAVTADSYVKKSTTLEEGTNSFTVEFTPDADFKFSDYEYLSSYETKTFSYQVEYKKYDRKVLYVSPEGSTSGTGSKESPLDIYTAVTYVKAGQIILLAGGTYSLTDTVTAARGIDGLEDAMIYLIGDESDDERPVFDFNKECAGMIFAGDYWYLQGFDVTRSEDGQKGLQLSGSYCVLDDINAYNNGNTGIQISRYLSLDNYEDWPCDNLVLNCTSYGNADKGYEDADGFAAKLTVGDGNVFDGCISYHNADDGWDLFAKVETGAIGQVVLKNCVAYGNGYLPDGTNAGNGNGFKLGGSSISGKHQLINCIAFDNKAKGIDSNSCPDIQVYNCTAFNNESYNVAMYTNDAANTDYYAEGILSFRTADKTIGDNISAKGTQDLTNLYKVSNYYWDGESQSSCNIENSKVYEAWFVNLDTNTQISRNSDGTINMNGLLELTDSAPEDTGARMTGRASGIIEISEETTPDTDDDSGSNPGDGSGSNPDDGTGGDDGTGSDSEDGSDSGSGKDSDSDSDSGIKIEIVGEDSGYLNITLPKAAKDKADWKETIQAITDKIKEWEANNKDGAEDEEFLITVEMNGATKLPKELLEALRGQKVEIIFNLGGGLSWVIKGNDITETELVDTDLAVTLYTNGVADTAVEEVLKDSESVTRNMQISLVQNGKFPFRAELVMDIKEALKKMFGSAYTDGDSLVAGLYYYDPELSALRLQSVSQVAEDKTVRFGFSHASEYVLVFGKALLPDVSTLDGITVNGVTRGETAETLLYVGGTVKEEEILKTVIPDSLMEALDKELISYEISYASDNKKVAAVTKDGKITAVSPGGAIITAKLLIGSRTLIFKTKVTVQNAYIKFIQKESKIAYGQKAVFEVAAGGFSKKDIVWWTDKKGIAVVGKNAGKTVATVTGKSEGTENVYAGIEKEDGSFWYAKTTIRVTGAVKKAETKKVDTVGTNTGKADTQEEKTQVYIVKNGDSLWKISQMYQCTVAELLALNDIKNPKVINIGQSIIIP